MYVADGARWCLPFVGIAAITAEFIRTTGWAPGWWVSDTTAVLEEGVTGLLSPVVAECPVISSATGAPDVFPMVNATARPAAAAGTAANGSRRLTGELAELSVRPKRVLPAKVALTGKAACGGALVMRGRGRPSERVTSQEHKCISVNISVIGQNFLCYVPYAAKCPSRCT